MASDLERSYPGSVTMTIRVRELRRLVGSWSDANFGRVETMKIKTLFGPRLLVTRLDEPEPPPVAEPEQDYVPGPDAPRRYRKGPQATQGEPVGLPFNVSVASLGENYPPAHGRVELLGTPVEQGEEWGDTITGSIATGSEDHAERLGRVMAAGMMGKREASMPPVKIGDEVVFHLYTAERVPATKAQYFVFASAVIGIVEPESPQLEGL